MPDQEAIVVADKLRAIMERKGVKLTALASSTSIPYRSLQNYFSRKTEMPVSAYLKICTALGIDQSYVSKERFDLDFHALQEALRVSLGPLLPKTEFNGTGALALVSNSDHTRSEAELQRDAGALAVFVRAHYDLVRERDVGQGLDPED